MPTQFNRRFNKLNEKSRRISWFRNVGPIAIFSSFTSSVLSDESSADTMEKKMLIMMIIVAVLNVVIVSEMVVLST